MQSKPAEVMCLTALTVLRQFRGRFEHALESAELAMQVGTELGATRFVSQSHAMLEECPWETGQLEAARRHAALGVELVRDSTMSFSGPLCLAVLARVSDDGARRDELFREVDDLLNSDDVLNHNVLFARRVGIRMGIAERDYAFALRQPGCPGRGGQRQRSRRDEALHGAGWRVGAVGQRTPRRRAPGADRGAPAPHGRHRHAPGPSGALNRRLAPAPSPRRTANQASVGEGVARAAGSALPSRP
jgi:hypothetical protein